jgi:hypothetical protein
MRKKTSGLNQWIVILLMAIAQIAQARDKLPVYDISYVSKGNEKLCGEIKAILENPINKDFGDWADSWKFKAELYTTAFNLPKDYNKIRWIEWKKVSLKDIRKYMDDPEWISRITNEGLGSERTPSALEKAVIPFPIEGKKPPQPIMMLRIIDSDSRYNQQRCHIPMASRKYFSKEFLRVNNMRVNYPWCNFFAYHGKLYHAAWMYAGNYQYDISGSIYITKQKYLTQGRTCSFNNGD